MVASDLVITPVTWPQLKQTLAQTQTGLLNLVGWYGSTHAVALWRKDPQFLALFQNHQIAGFNPQLMTSWDPSYAITEAEVMATASVVIIRLENNELLNGSLGSIAEIGLALTSAALRGQIVVVSIEAGLLTSLNEPGAIAQYMILEMYLDHWEKSPQLSGLLHIHRGDDLANLAAICCQAAQQQMATAQHVIDFAGFLEKKARREHNYPLRVVLGGSGGPYAEALNPIFLQKKQALIQAYQAKGQTIKILSEGAIADAWKIPYGSLDPIGVALTTRTLLTIESEYKHEADVLLLPIMAEASSKAAATEIGMLLLNALISGQTIKIYLEPFNPVDFIRHQLQKLTLPATPTEKSMRLALHEAGVDDAILAIAIQSEVEDTFQIFKALMQGQELPLNQVKNSLLGQTATFQNADNIRRVRALVDAHLQRLHADTRFANFFTYATSIKI